MKLTTLSAITLFTAIVTLSWCSSTNSEQNTKLAECLTSKWTTMYWTNRCSHCQAQKDLFGYEAFSKINFIDCDKEKNVCNLEGIQWYPTWKFTNWSKLEWEQTFEALAKSAWCNLDGSSVSNISTGIIQETTTGDLATWESITGSSIVSTGINSGN
jgi:hypothetical protein